MGDEMLLQVQKLVRVFFFFAWSKVIRYLTEIFSKKKRRYLTEYVADTCPKPTLSCLQF